MRMAVDRNKDQSYFLFPITPKALARTMFPLGGMSKPEVRAHAERLGLATASKPESQDVCFLPDDDHTRFVAERYPDLDASGDIVDESGRVLGQHDAYYRYTVGQRRGLGVALGFPAYVVRVEPETKQVVVAPASRLTHQGRSQTAATGSTDQRAASRSRCASDMGRLGAVHHPRRRRRHRSGEVP